jgi:aminocarboxymuconate-semialdehyde decarboxylase
MMGSFVRCAPAGEVAGGGSPIRVNRGGKNLVIDIHCHLNIPAAEALVRPHLAQHAFQSFMSPASDAVNRELFQKIGSKLNNIAERIGEMDKLGIDVQAISPSPPQMYYDVEADLGRQAAEIVNNGIAEAVARFPDRFVGMGTVPLQSAELAVLELRRCVNALGLRGIEISSHVAGHELSEEQFRPFFAAAEAMGVLLFIHPLGFTHGQRLTEHYFNNLIGNPLESAIAVGHLIFGGVLDRYPGLKVCVAHGGGYLPSYWGRMDHAWRARADCRQCAKLPSEYLRQMYFDTLVFDPKHLRFLVDTYGPEHLLLGTDYPFDMAEPDPVGFHDGLNDKEKAAILGGNAARLLKLAGHTTAR